jgi:hypothetical protein
MDQKGNRKLNGLIQSVKSAGPALMAGGLAGAVGAAFFVVAHGVLISPTANGLPG